jgi:hypothetical protein
MTRSRYFLSVLAIAAAGGDGSHRTPAQVVHAWSAASSRGDEEAAAALFGPVYFRIRDGKIVFFDQIGA